MVKINFEHSGISTLIKDYLKQKDKLKPFYALFPHKENYAIQAKDKLSHYQHRQTLVSVLEEQMKNLELTDKQSDNLNLLKKDNTVTVTTGHQLNLMTGPLYFIYKILHVVKICDELNQNQQEIHYVPIFWMATEDHDFQEINHFQDYRSRYEYSAEEGGFVGEISSENTKQSLLSFMENLSDNKFDQKLKQIIRKAYFQKYDLSTATRILVHELLGEFGILILDANHAALKKLMIPYFQKELCENQSQKLVEVTNQKLSSYKNQAYAREINLFYLENNKRERIEKTKDGFILVDSHREFSDDEMRHELLNFPEKFSPNVILRPLYQEVVLPNVAYIGGGGEIAYWLQLKSVFENFDTLFPMLVVRNSMLIVPNAMKHKAAKYDLLGPKIFESKSVFKNKFTQKQSELFDELQSLEKNLIQQFESMEKIAEKTSPSFSKMLEAQKQKQLKGYKKMHQRLLKSEQKRFEQEIQKIDEIYAYFYPQNNWQERVINFSEFYSTNGFALFERIYDNLDAFESNFNILNLDSIAKN